MMPLNETTSIWNKTQNHFKNVIYHFKIWNNKFKKLFVLCGGFLLFLIWSVNEFYCTLHCMILMWWDNNDAPFRKVGKRNVVFRVSWMMFPFFKQGTSTFSACSIQFPKVLLQKCGSKSSPVCVINYISYLIFLHTTLHHSVLLK